MAYTRVTNTRDGQSAISYAFDEPTHKEGLERVLLASGSNLDPKFATQQMKATWENFGKADGDTVQMYRIIQSFGFDELNPNNLEDVENANAMGLALASELYPDKQSLIVTQADGEGGKLHNHILVNSVGFVDGKSLRGNRKEWKAISAKSDEIIQRYGLEPIRQEGTRNRRTMAERKLAGKGEYVWKDDLKERITQTLGDTTVISRDAFIERMRDESDVDVRFRGKGVSYAFLDDNEKKRIIRSGRLGEDFGREELDGQFNRNNESQQKVEVSPVSEVFSFDIDSELEALSKAHTPRKRRNNSPVVESSVQKEVRLEREARKEARRIDNLHGEALVENGHIEALQDDSLWEQSRDEAIRQAEQEKFEQDAQAERERVRMQEKAERDERQRRIQLQREHAEKRIQGAMITSRPIQPEYVTRFMESVVELKGQTRASVIPGKRESYKDIDIVRYTNGKIREEQKQASQQAVVEHVRDLDAPEL